MKQLSVPDTHRLAIAKKTMRMNCVGATIMGGPNHPEAQEIIQKLTGKTVALPEGCTCHTSG